MPACAARRRRGGGEQRRGGVLRGVLQPAAGGAVQGRGPTGMWMLGGLQGRGCAAPACHSRFGPAARCPWRVASASPADPAGGGKAAAVCAPAQQAACTAAARCGCAVSSQRSPGAAGAGRQGARQQHVRPAAAGAAGRAGGALACASLSTRLSVLVVTRRRCSSEAAVAASSTRFTRWPVLAEMKTTFAHSMGRSWGGHGRAACELADQPELMPAQRGGGMA